MRRSDCFTTYHIMSKTHALFMCRQYFYSGSISYISGRMAAAMIRLWEFCTALIVIPLIIWKHIKTNWRYLSIETTTTVVSLSTTIYQSSTIRETRRITRRITKRCGQRTRVIGLTIPITIKQRPRPLRSLTIAWASADLVSSREWPSTGTLITNG